MSFFNPEVALPQKEKSHHPWEKCIKDSYSHIYKYGHNSVRNPAYPKKEEKQYENRVQLTVIGNKVTKEFIYCYFLVKGLYKYRQKQFEAPIIRAVTGVEWPTMWNNLKVKYGGFAHCLTSQVAILVNDKFLGGEAELKKYIESKYVYRLCFDYYKEGILQFTNYIKSVGRPYAYMHISINDKHIGTMIFMLYADIVPLTCENFLRLCHASKGGYGGTPIHRIVKDSWIQCGGFGLKNNPRLDCENFIVPHDRRGVLCMANNGRHVDCSTQFFVLLQPAPWMASKYVAFGQLIDGEGTLSRIESIPIWYESPTEQITIFKAGVFNVECHWLPINKNTNEYLQSHIEDLLDFAQVLYEDLLKKVFVEAEARRLQAELIELIQNHNNKEDNTRNIYETESFKRKKKEIERRLKGIQIDYRTTASVIGSSSENQEFDIDDYEYDFKETPSLVVKPKKPYYLPFTDVLYPGEVDSAYDLQRYLRGDYCHEADMEHDHVKRKQAHEGDRGLSIPDEILGALFGCFSTDRDDESESSLDSNDQRLIREYIKANVADVSFAGPDVKRIANISQKFDIFDTDKNEKPWKNTLSDEELRLIRVAAKEYKGIRAKKISFDAATTRSYYKINRQVTKFLYPEDLELSDKDHSSAEQIEEEEYRAVAAAASRKIRISSLMSEPRLRNMSFLRQAESQFQNVLARLFENVAVVGNETERRPTLKDFVPYSEVPQNSFIYLTNSPKIGLIGSPENVFRHPSGDQLDSIDHVLELQHGKRIYRKISSDYVRTIDRIEHPQIDSIRTIEFAKRRPSISVKEYKMRNHEYFNDLKTKDSPDTHVKRRGIGGYVSGRVGIRLPGDTPLYGQSVDDLTLLRDLRKPKSNGGEQTKTQNDDR